ncbi:MAG: hypothetical protein AB1744_16215, partial [Candidatus Zixiibacteriota bacterium]
IVLKPTLLGLEGAAQFARQGLHLGLTPVISAAFESGLGIALLAELAASVLPTDTPAGLDTLSFFMKDLMVTQTPIRNGRITLADRTCRRSDLCSQFLTEVTL